MKNKQTLSIHIGIVLAVMAAGLLIGSFADFEISRALYFARHPFWVFWSAVIGPLLCCAGLSFYGMTMAGNLAAHKEHPLLLKIVLLAVGLAMALAGIYVMQHELSSVNGYDLKGAMKILSWGISLAFNAAVGVFGFFVGKRIRYRNYWILVLIIAAVYFVPMLGLTTLLKDLFHRPRFRILVDPQSSLTASDFHNWWEPFHNYAGYITETVTSEEFKSFPSGHSCFAATSMIAVTFLPFVDERLEGVKLPLFYCGFAYYIITAFSRIRLGAHFLSDVSVGGMIVAISLLAANIAVDKNTEFFLSEYPREE